MGGQIDTEYVYGNFTDEQLYDSFNATVEERAYNCGHGGYTGTMAESNGTFYIFTKIFDDANEALKYVEEHVGCHSNEKTILEMFSTKNWTNCARFTTKEGKKGAVYGGNYSY